MALVLGAGYAGLALAAMAGSLPGFLCALVITAVVEALVAWRFDKVHAALESMQLGGTLRLLVRSGLLVLLVAAVPGGPSWLAAATVVVLVATHGVRFVALAAQRTVRERSVWPLTWRNMEVPELGVPVDGRLVARRRRVATAGVGSLDVVITIGVALAVWGFSPGSFVAASFVAIVTAAAVALAARSRAAALLPRDRADVVAAVRAAVEAIAPRVVVYFGGPPSSTHALNVWMPVLEQLDEPVLVMVRQRVHLEQMSSTRLPAVWAPKATDVEDLAVPSIDLALYPTNIAQNNHLIRVPGITDVFVGHGDSDKGGSFTPLSRIYDQVWVAGPAGRDRYRGADVGVRDDQIREVGRPQLAEIARRGRGLGGAGASELFTVLYAPTWEGFYAAWSYSSLLSMGERIVSELMSLEGVRVLVKPHPASGSVDKAYGRAARHVTSAVHTAGGPHRVVGGVSGLYDAFNEADLLVTDVSSVVTDFLWSGKPYVMTNPRGLAEDEYRREFPSSRGAALWGSELATLRADIDDARTTDRRRSERNAAARYLLGEVTDDAVAGFNAAVRDVLAIGSTSTRSTSQ